MNDKVSIIVPVYDVAKYVEKCLKSILDQTYSDIEIIIVNDGSTDGSEKVCEAFKSSDPRIKIVHQKNQGLSQARNAAIPYITGSFIVFIDSDDYVENSYIEDLYTSLKKNNADIAVCGFYNQFKNRTVPFSIKEQRLEAREATYLLVQDDNMPSYVWNKIYKRELWEGILFPAGRKFEDTYVMHKVFMRSRLVSVIDKPLYHYMRREDSITGVSKLSNTEDTFLALRARRDDLAGTEFYHTACLTELQKMRATLCEMRIINDDGNNPFKDRLNRDIRSLYKEERKYIDLSQRIKFDLFFLLPGPYSRYLQKKTMNVRVTE